MKLKRLEKMRTGGSRTKMQLSIPVPKTPDGRVYRYSPNIDAHPRHFVLSEPVVGFVADPERAARMKYPPGTRGTVCPYSGVRADDAEFTHPDDRKAAIKIIKQTALQDARDAFSDMLADVARGSKSITYKPAARPSKPRPRFGRRDLMRLLVCDCCGRDYGVFAIALFCPDCGAPNLALHFAREAELVGQQVDLAASQSKENQELAYRLLGNAHEDVLTAFEATLKVAYVYRVQNRPPGSALIKPVSNDFQNIDKGRKRFDEFSFDPFAELDAAELAVLSLNIQKRHLIGHNLGVVDAKFAQHAKEAKLGETVELVAADIRAFAALCKRVVRRIDDMLGDVPLPPPAGETEEKAMPSATETVADLTPEGSAVGKWICKASVDGLPWHLDEDALIAAFPNLSTDQLAEALADLAEDDYVSLAHTISERLPRIHVREDLFLTFDPICMESDPVADALQLIPLVLAKDSVNVPGLHAESAMPLRRFNPAIGMIISEIGERRVSGAWVEGYPTPYFFVVDSDRVAIKRLARRLEG
ncbi:hypothetical protein EOA60_26225 [Mesorhizobium sp. M1A.F.Ca.IN.020.06.1.1]|uniref:hypothetical protein n=1 Tax=unclassified Mesorhizobium TaxID=325217 RepID=UPI000FD55AE7|nr:MULTISPECIES: hypothetical protein [unclassified Mesorhizobium]RUW20161.1 hypothetical protein EOA60_26225 [Mesorhizobium sp. M1A.F.Ca.IN.020.06.1.1]RWF82912.1 MAG: hypothetical protein EOQ35_08320 [Mesorhizobium sp.]RWG05692.1 MAG: hypothetical protein EOQ38_03385 [Mesorhizobium sp.]RWG89658.1 MAG: hypothetical protein EOQ68_09175 [Mesorhizobium sp.]RWH07875.1 MAG: hypothetical protein EOQ73_00635 [Mesorhizobium sp.]